MKNVLTICLIFSIQITSLAQIKDNNYYSDIAKAMGYYYGMEVALDLIEEKYPVLAAEAIVAKMNLKIAHGKAMNNMELIYEDTGGNIQELKDDVLEILITQHGVDNFSFYEAKEYLNTFEEARIFGNSELTSDLVRILLSHNSLYLTYPAKEFLDNYRNLFKTNNHPKSKGLNLSLEYPKSWSSREGKRPNVITLIQNASKDCLATLLIQDFWTGMGIDTDTLSTDEIEYIMSGELISDIITDGEYHKEVIYELGFENITMIDTEVIKIDRHPARVIKFRGTKPTLLGDIEAYNVIYQIAYENYLINVDFMISLNGQENPQEHIDKNVLLSKLIVSSLIIENQW
jgi:hypothetical protein